MVSKQSTKDLTLRGWSLLNVVLLVVFAVHPKKSVCDLPIEFAIQDCLFSWNLTSTK